MDQSKHPIHINEEFTCEKCGKIVKKQEKTCRNHCNFCLFSKHVDKKTPGDRASGCKGLMEPVAITSSSKGKQIKHKCIKCGKTMLNILADDDNVDAVIMVMNAQNAKPVKNNQ